MITGNFVKILDPLFEPLLSLPILLSVSLLALLVSIIITVIYKLMTDQNMMKQLKEEMKELQGQMKELRNHPEKMMEVQKKSMQTNSKYMMQSMKSTLITFLPIILIFGWMNANIAYDPLFPNVEFTVDAMFNRGAFGEVKLEVPEGITVMGNATQSITNNKATWVLKGEEGDYINNNAVKVIFNDQVEYKDLFITNEQKYTSISKTIRNSPLRMIKVNHESKRVLTLFGAPFNFLGFRGGWLGTYIIISMITSIILRKLLKVY